MPCLLLEFAGGRARQGGGERAADRGTTGLPKGAKISQRALTECVRLMPSLFRIGSHGGARSPGRGCTSRPRCNATAKARKDRPRAQLSERDP